MRSVTWSDKKMALTIRPNSRTPSRTPNWKYNHMHLRREAKTSQFLGAGSRGQQGNQAKEPAEGLKFVPGQNAAAVILAGELFAWDACPGWAAHFVRTLNKPNHLTSSYVHRILRSKSAVVLTVIAEIGRASCRERV